MNKVGTIPEWQEAGGLQGESQPLDQQLIQQAQGGDADAFGRLYERHAPVIFRFIYSHLDNRLDAEDLTEEVFLKVWKALPNYRDQGTPFIAFLFRIARNVVIDYYRRAKQSNKDVSLEDNVIRDDRPDPSEIALKGIEHREIRELLEQLREDYRTVLVLRFIGDLTPDETAEIMGKSAGAVRVLQHRALAALRKLIGS